MPGFPARQFHPLPAPGDIVWCRFPQALGLPGPKSRPALVVRVARARHEVAVVYGTSQKTRRLYPTEFVLDPADAGFVVSGLSHRTKFDLAVLVQLPFNTQWFAPAPGSVPQSPLPKMGVLHPSYMAVASAARGRVKP